jgi:hypothetical protein
VLATAVLPICRAGSKEDKKASKPVVIDGELKASDAKDRKLKESPAQSHKVKMTKGVTYVIDLVSKDFDAYLRLEDTAGTFLAEDDDSGGGSNARLFFIPPDTAEYVLIATCYRPKTGKYKLTIQEANVLVRPLELVAGTAAVKDKLTLKSAKSPFSPHTGCVLYRVALKAGTIYVIDLESADFDAYLTLADAGLRVLASDDDSGGNRNARIRFECKQDGSYHIAATGLGLPEGAFQLRIQAAK